MLRSLALAMLLLMSTACGGGNTAPPPPPDPPQILAIAPEGGAGLPGASVTFSATVKGEVDSWDWTFSDGAEPISSVEATPTVALQKSGSLTATVVATNEGGSSAPVSSTVTVSPPVIPAWSFATVPIASGQQFPIAFFCINNDRVVVQANNELALAQVANPSSLADWTTYPINFGVEFSGTPISIEGRLILIGSSLDPVSGKRPGTLAFANVPLPSSAADWTLVRYSEENDFPQAVVKLDTGWALLSLRSQQNPADVRVFITWEDDPLGSANWGSYSVKPAELFENPFYSLLVSDQKLIVSFGTERAGFTVDQIRFGSSTSLHPEKISEWNFHELDVDFAGGADVQTMELFRGKPVIAWSNGNALFLHSAMVKYPDQASDWILGGFGVDTGPFFDLKVAHDRLIVSAAGTYFRQTDITSFAQAGGTLWEQDAPFPVGGSVGSVYTFNTLPYEDRLVTLFYGTEGPTLAFSDGPW